MCTDMLTCFIASSDSSINSLDGNGMAVCCSKLTVCNVCLLKLLSFAKFSASVFACISTLESVCLL